MDLVSSVSKYIDGKRHVDSNQKSNLNINELVIKKEKLELELTSIDE